MNRWVTNTCQAISYGPLYEPVLSKISAVILLTYWVDLYEIFNCVMTWKRFSAYCCVGGIHTSYFWFAYHCFVKELQHRPTIDHRCIDHRSSMHRCIAPLYDRRKISLCMCIYLYSALWMSFLVLVLTIPLVNIIFNLVFYVSQSYHCSCCAFIVY